MKKNDIICLVSAVVGIAALAAGVAVIVDRILKKKSNCCDCYIESDCTPEVEQIPAEEN